MKEPPLQFPAWFWSAARADHSQTTSDDTRKISGRTCVILRIPRLCRERCLVGYGETPRYETEEQDERNLELEHGGTKAG